MKIFSTIKDIFSIEELRNRIINTIGFILIFRIGSYILLPGVNPASLDQGDVTGMMGVIDSFLGGAFSNKAIFGLGIMPYISASIVLQLLTVAVPYFQKLQKEGESGRKKITQITRVLTIAICVVQSFGFIALIRKDNMLFPDVDPNFFTAYSVLILTAGTMFCMWLGEKITEKGIGNGISLLIMVGIISRLPASVIAEVMQKGTDGPLLIVMEFVALFFIVMLTVMITQAVRRIPISYAKQIVGNKVYGGQRQYLPLKVNAAGVMPIIFAQALMFLPSMIAGSIGEGGNQVAIAIARAFSTPTSWEYNTLSAIMIVLFTYFYTAITIQPNQIADDLKRNGGFVPGIKPGLATGEYIDTILSRITLPGALLIALIAIMPAFAMMGGVNPKFAQFFGGTSLLILVGVILDTLQQIESFLLMRQYDGMMKSGKVKGRPSNMSMA